MNIPQGYKQTELGIIPEDWEVKQIRDGLNLLTDFDANGSFADMAENVQTYNGGGYAWYVRATDLEQNTPLSDVKYVDEASYKFLKKSSLHGGEVLIAKRGDIGKVYLFQAKTTFATLAPNLYLLKLNEQVHSTYLYYYLKSINGQKALKDINASTSLGALYKEDVKNLYILYPPIAEQRAIAAALSDVDGLIAALDKKIAKKRLIKQGAMQQLLTGKKRLSGFTDEWVEKKLGEICSIIIGQSPSSEYYNTQNRGLPLIQGNADLENRQQVVRFYTSQITKECEKGDVILSVRAPVGAVGKATHKSCLGRGVCAIKTDNDFLYHYLVYIENDWSSFSKGSTFDSINSDELYQLSLVLPQTKNERQAIATILSDMDEEIADLEAQRNKYRLLKSGMMQKLLIGQIRLKTE